MNSVKIRKNGTFYNVFDKDMYILYFLLNYQIKNDKIGFPKSALNKVINILEENKISYEVIGENINNNFKNLNKYNNYYQKGLKKHEKDIYYTDIIDKLNNLNEEKLNKILEFIEGILDE